MKSHVEFIETKDLGEFGMSNQHFASSIDLRILDPLHDADWDRLVVSHPDGNFFHSAVWAKVLVQTYGHKPFYLAFFRQCQPVALVPIMEIKSPFTGRRGICLPFSDFCCPRQRHPPGNSMVTKFACLRTARSCYFDSRVRCAAQFGKPRKAA